MGVSNIGATFPINNENPFSIKRPIDLTYRNNWILAVRWEIEPGIAARYKLWTSTNLVPETLYFPVYAGERIGVNAVLEVWSIYNLGALELTENFVLYTSRFSVPSTCGCCPSVSPESVQLTQHEPTFTVYGACNPFCLDLCEV